MDDIGSPPTDAASIDPTDWTTLCQSELAALAVDREFAEGLALAASLWNASIASIASIASHDPRGPASSHAAQGAAPGGAASRDGGSEGELAALRRRLAELERTSAS